MVCFEKRLVCCLYVCLCFQGGREAEPERSSAAEIETRYRHFGSTKEADTTRIPDDPGQGHAAGPPLLSRATWGPMATEDCECAENKIGSSLGLGVLPRTSFQDLELSPHGGRSLLFCLWGIRTIFWSRDPLPSHCPHFQFRVPLAKCSFLFLRKDAERAFWRPQTVSEGFLRSKQQFDELSVNDQRHMDYILGEIHMDLQCKAGQWGWEGGV